MPEFPVPRDVTRAAIESRGGVSLRVRGELDAMHADQAYAHRITQGVGRQFAERARWFGHLAPEAKLTALHAGTAFAVNTIQTETRLAEAVTIQYLHDYPTLDDRVKLGAEETGNKLRGYMQQYNRENPGKGSGMAYKQKGIALQQNATIIRDYPELASMPAAEQRLLISGFHTDAETKLLGLGYPKAGFAVQLGTGAGQDMAVMDIHNVSALGLPREYAQLPRSQQVRVTKGLEGLVTKYTGQPSGVATWTAWSIGVTGEPVPHANVFRAMGAPA